MAAVVRLYQELMVSWLSVNDAIPLGSDPELKVIQSTTFEPNIEFLETVPITGQPIVTSTPISGNGRAYRSIDSINYGSHINRYEIMDNSEGLTQRHQVRQKDRENPLEVSETDDNNNFNINFIGNARNSIKDRHRDLGEWEIPLSNVQLNEKCVNEERRKNQTYTRSIPLRTSSINPDEDFKFTGEPEAKKTSSVHIGEDIALCWIETTTIKEDNYFDPPKRLVIREFTISFENSASIPDSYLECNNIEGEIAPGDEDTIRNTALHEVIDENSKRSRQVNFTLVNSLGRVIIRQHKKVKCGVGAVVSKDIFEWPDDTDNPKKRVEIKVGPSIRDLRSTPDSRGEECTSGSIPRKAHTDNNRTSFSTSGDETLSSCESGDCSRTVTSCEGDCSRQTPSEEITYPPNSNELLSTGVTEATTTSKPNETEFSMPLGRKPDQHQDEPCSELDTDCMFLQSTTVEPERVDKTFESCSDEDCLGGSSKESTRELPCDQNSDASCLCSGDNCRNEQNLTSDADDSAQITMQNDELCKNGSESCICFGLLCPTEGSNKFEYLESEDKQTDDSPSVTNRTTINPLGKLPPSIPVPQMDSKCNGQLGICSGTNVPPQFNSAKEQNSMEIVDPTILDENLNTGPFSQQNGTTEVPDASTKLVEGIGYTPEKGNVPFCNHSDLRNCLKVRPDDSILQNAIIRDTEELYSSSEDTPSQEILRKQLKNKSISPTTQQSMPVTTIRSNNAETELPTTNSNQVIDHWNEEMIESIFEISTDQETSTEKSSTDQITTGTVTTSLTDVTTVPSSLEASVLPPQSCDNSGNCRSMEGLSMPDDTNEKMGVEIQDKTKTASICDDGDETCQDSFSSRKTTETCEDGSTNCSSGSNEPISTPCDSASGSCSSEINESGMSTTTQLTLKELEFHSTNNDTFSSIAETRRSIASTTSLPISGKGRHRLGLRIKVLLEHIDENKEKEKLIEVEKHLLLKENDNEHGNHSLMWQLQALNDSMNLETLKAIFNCSALKSLSADEIDVDKLSKDVINAEINDLKEVRQNTEENVYSNKRTVVSSKENSESLTDNDGDQYNFNYNSNVNLNNRRKREIASSLDITTESENYTDSTTVVSQENATDSTTVVSQENATDSTTVASQENATDSTTVVSQENATDSTIVFSVENVTNSTNIVSAENVTDLTDILSVEKGIDSTTSKTILQSLPEVEEDLTNGMNHVLSLISKELGDSTTTDSNTTPSSFSSKILKILSDPADSRVHYAGSEIIPRIKRAVKVQELNNPVHGEEIEQWSKERFVRAANGGQIRRLTEFKLLRDIGEVS